MFNGYYKTGAKYILLTFFLFCFRVFLLFTFAMILAAAFFVNDEVYEEEKCLKNKNNFSITLNNNNNDESAPDLNILTVPNKECIANSGINSKESGTRTIHRFVRCFSISKNAKSIMCTKSSPNAMPTLNAFK